MQQYSCSNTAKIAKFFGYLQLTHFSLQDS